MVPTFNYVKWKIIHTIAVVALPLCLTSWDNAMASGLDVVMVIDQSGSMIGSAAHPGANDPAGHRISAAQVVLNRLAQSVDENPAVHRVSIIEFGTTVVVPVSAAEFLYSPSDRGRPLEDADRAGAALKVRDLGDTHTHEALARAVQEFATMAGKATASGGDRKRHLLLVTDGRPYAEDGKSPLIATEVWRRVTTEMAKLSAQDVTVWVVGLDQHSEYWPTDGPRWASMVGSPARVKQANGSFPDLQRLISLFVGQWLGGGTIMAMPGSAGDRVILPPYLGRVVFEIHVREPIAPPRVLAPDGRIVPLQGTAKPGLVSFHVLDAPLSGEYRVEGAGGAAVLTVADTEPPRLSRVSPGHEAAMDVATTVSFKATGMSAGGALQEDPRYPILAQIEIKGPDGKTMRLPAKLDSEGRFNVSWTPAVIGVHEFAVNARYRDNGGVEHQIFPAATPQQVTITEAPLALTFRSPDLLQRAKVPLGGEGVPVILNLIQGAAPPLADAATLVRDPASWLAAWPTGSSGVATGPAIPVAYADGQFSFTLPVSFDLWRGEGWLRPKAVSFRLSPAPGRLAQNRQLSELKLPAGSEGLRVQGDPLSVGPLQAALPLWIPALMGLLLLTLLTAMAAVLYLIFGQAWLLRLMDARRGAPIELVLYELNGDPGCASPLLRKTLDGIRRVDLATDVRRRKPAKDPVVFQKLRIRRSWQDRGATALVEFEFKGGTGGTPYPVRLQIGQQGKDLPPHGEERWRLQLRTPPALGRLRTAV